MIDWEKKKELCIAINNDDYKKIESFVDKYIQDFDTQAWDMFSNITLIEKKYSSGFFEKIKPHYKKAYDSGILDNLSFRSAVRLEMFFGEDKNEV